MRLNSIRLAGFKSFADATQFALPGQLVGVVGPNGCGKSNIMDAVRWVLGESKASELRGESMQDVIFNGASGRKPAGRASVELVFGNESGRAGGPWGRFAEIAVKRVLSRDGASTYSINGQVVRRRDVQDVFLGTGLGPRAYAIIGQGTISRIIESRPDELRLFLEEAAGVSKYKERRRETEAKLRDTRENLTRVADIQRELNAQVAKLGAQAGVAQRYQALVRLARWRRHQWWHVQLGRSAAEATRLQAELRSAETALSARTADLRRVEAELADVHVARDAAADLLHRASGRSTEAALEVSRLEERARQLADAQRRVAERQTAAAAERAHWRSRLDAAHADLAEASERTGELDALAAVTTVTADAHTASLPAATDAVAAARRRLADSRDALVAVQQQLQLLAAESRHLATQRQQFDAQHARLLDEQHRSVPPDLARLDALRQRADDAEAAVAEARQRQQQTADEATALDAHRCVEQARARDAEARATAVAARSSAVEAVQARLQSPAQQAPWLARQGLAGAAPLWQQLRTVAGWEPALEAVLRERLGAFRVESRAALTAAGLESDPSPVKTVLYVLPDGDAAQPSPVGTASVLVDAQLGRDAADVPRSAFRPSTEAAGAADHAEPEAAPRGRALVDLVDVDAGLRPLLADWLGAVECSDGLADALARQPTLRPGETLVTPDGHLVRRWSVALYAPDAEQAGLLARAREIAALRSEETAERAVADDAARALAAAEAACQSAAAALSAARAATAAAQADGHRLQVDLVRASQQAEQAQALAARLEVQIADAAAGRDRVLHQAADVQQRSAAVDVQLGPLQQGQARSQTELQVVERRLADARDEQRRLDRLAQDAVYAARSGGARVAECGRALAAAEQQLDAVERQGRDLLDEAARLDAAAAGDPLQAALARRLACDAELAAARDAADAVARQWRQADEARLAHQQALQPLHDAIVRLQLQVQAAEIAAAQLGEQLDAEQVDRARLAQSVLDDAVVEADLPAEIERLDKHAAALGAVNLAAVEELAAAEERKGFLDAQCRDLEAAMATLEGAIRTIDLETRDLLGTTFEQVNAHFGRLFPVLFGGGEARLAMTGAEILDAGVQVLAQPPGKKNSSIALLSGGEKALTAIALVFAIFHLNPAPFCLLDEVDAPLDDANTERYARLVRDMSAGTQFLFISHNRIAMEMAGQLIGVTMQEQGVSRIVAVDVNSAGLALPATA